MFYLVFVASNDFWLFADCSQTLSTGRDIILESLDVIQKCPKEITQMIPK